MGSIPPQVIVPAKATSASFTYTAGGVVQVEKVTATLGAGMASSSLSVVGRLVINEVDYDQPAPGSDDKEFIELYNGTGAAVDLADLVIYRVNGSDNQSDTALSLASGGTLGVGQYLVVVWNDALAMSLPVGTKLIKFTAGTGKIQNGSPDGLALVNKATGELIDALSYAGSITAASIPGIAMPVSLVEGTPTAAVDSNSVVGSLCRLPDGLDTNNAVMNWSFSSTPTPGAANVP
jgi:hypothetical protein